ILDFYIDGEQEPQFGTFESERQSCRRFMKLSHSELELEPRGHTSVRFTVRPSADSRSGTYYCAVGFTTTPAPWSGSAGLAVSVRIVATFYLTIGGSPEPLASLKRAYWEKDSNDASTERRLICELDNPGRYVWRPVGFVDLLDSDGAVLVSRS